VVAVVAVAVPLGWLEAQVQRVLLRVAAQATQEELLLLPSQVAVVEAGVLLVPTLLGTSEVLAALAPHR
tara:strand:+ start:231 stop:437 length:207 start_codon:yes stop_codon:yes gene_type:complete